MLQGWIQDGMKSASPEIIRLENNALILYGPEQCNHPNGHH